MKRTSFFLLLFAFSFSFFSCDREQFLDNRIDRLEGTWEVHRVRFSEEFQGFWSNITNEYQSVVVYFSPEETLEWINNAEGTNYVGSYSLYYYNDVGGGDGSESAIRLEAILYEETSGDQKIIDWENLSVGTNRIRFTVRNSGKSYQFTLKKR